MGGTIEQRLKLLRLLIQVATGLAIILTGGVVGCLYLILMYLPDNPNSALIGLLQTILTGLVGALGVMVGSIGTGIGAYFTFRSAKETSGDETPAAP